MTKLLDGLILAKKVQDEVCKVIREKNICPRLDVLLVGNNPASEIYVNKKREACMAVGINTHVHRFNETDDVTLVKDRISLLNEDSLVNGILVQLPLPKHYNIDHIFDLIAPFKDVDVFNPVNVGLLVQNRPRFIPPTPSAIRELLHANGITLKGKHVLIISRSNIIGKPLSSMLIQDNGEYANATVTVVHDQTPFEELKKICLITDIIVVAVGIPEFLTCDMVTENHVIIDVGISRVGKKIVGDVHPEVCNKVAWVSKVPGGVGPLVVSFLLKNTLKAYLLQNNLDCLGNL
jgi:methylenetetrahydrofolate dehydrogenase (NADP+)/methenyltetrahydrofolate cyclohydrolase